MENLLGVEELMNSGILSGSEGWMVRWMYYNIVSSTC